MNFDPQSSAVGLSSLGRGEDSMLVHMTPAEVASLQQLAMQNGGSLTTNPETGLPEAGFLGDILPAIAGVGLTLMGVPPIWAGLGIGALTGLVTGDMGEGVKAGLGAYGGAGLGELAGVQNAVTSVAPVTSTATVGQTAAQTAARGLSPTGGIIGAGQAVPVVSGAATNMLPKQGLSNLFSKEGAKYGLAAAAPFLASSMQDQTGGMPAPGDADDMSKRYPYKGPYMFDEGAPSYLSDEQLRDADSSEWNYFPNIRYPQKYYAEGGEVDSSEQMYFPTQNPSAAPAAPGVNPALARIQNAIRSPGGLMGLVDPSFNARAEASNARWNQARQYMGPSNAMGYAYGQVRQGYDKLAEIEKQQAEAKQKSTLASAVNPAAAAFVPGQGYSDQGEQSYFSPDYFRFAEGGDTGGYLRGPGDGMSDDIPAIINHGGGKQQPARLSAGEFVIPADVVGHLGNDDHESGANRLYAMMDRIRQARTGTTKQHKKINPDKFLPA